MSHVISDTLFAAENAFRRALDGKSPGQELRWADDVHASLGRLADAIQEELRAAEQEMEDVGDINPDFQNAPALERHTETMREQLIRLGEQVHQLRTEMRTVRDKQDISAADDMHQRGEEIGTAVAKLRHVKNDFLLKTFNSNPGSGE